MKTRGRRPGEEDTRAAAGFSAAALVAYERRNAGPAAGAAGLARYQATGAGTSPLRSAMYTAGRNLMR